MSTGEVAAADSHIHPLDVSRLHLQQTDSSRSRTSTSTEMDGSYMGYVCVTLRANSYFFNNVGFSFLVHYSLDSSVSQYFCYPEIISVIALHCL